MMSDFIAEPNLITVRNALVDQLTPEIATRAGTRILKIFNNGCGIAGSKSRIWQQTCSLFLIAAPATADEFKLFSLHRHEINQPDLYVTLVKEDWLGLPYRSEDNTLVLREEAPAEENWNEKTSLELKAFLKAAKVSEGFWIQLNTPGAMAREGIFITEIKS
jgi:hypothetical protein